MKVTLLLDEDVHVPVAEALRKRGYDVAHVQELARKGKADSEQLSYAVEQERSFLSFNVKDFVLLHNQYVQKQKEHCGIIVSKQLSIRATIHGLLRILNTFSQESIKNQILFL